MLNEIHQQHVAPLRNRAFRAASVLNIGIPTLSFVFLSHHRRCRFRQ